MKKSSLLVILGLSFLLILPLGAKAFTVKSNNSVYVPKNETVEGNLYAAGNNVIIEGNVTGDVICAAQSVNITGSIGGDVICAGQTVSVNGPVNGNVRIAGSAVSINNTVGRNVNAFGASINLGSNAQIGWDMFIAAASADIRGKISGSLHGASANTVIAGSIGQDVRIMSDNGRQKNNTKMSKPITIEDQAQIGGNVSYTSDEEGVISDKAEIKGQVTHNLPKKYEMDKNWFAFMAWGKIISIFSALVVGLVIISLWRDKIKKFTDYMRKNPSPSMAWGVLIVLVTPIIVMLLCMTIIGIPLALIILALWFILLYVGKILTGILIGRMIFEKLWPSQKDPIMKAMILGIILTYLVLSIPVLGFILSFLAISWGAGVIMLYVKK